MQQERFAISEGNSQWEMTKIQLSILLLVGDFGEASRLKVFTAAGQGVCAMRDYSIDTHAHFLERRRKMGWVVRKASGERQKR